MRRGPVPEWWVPVCALTCALQGAATLLRFVDPIAAAVPAGLGLIGFVVITVAYFRAPRL